MADNVPITAGSGTSISTEDVTTLNGGVVSSQHVQRIAAAIRTADGTAIDLPGDASNGLDVDVTRLPALPAGSNNIGDVDVVTVPADPFGANADAAATAGSTGSIQAKLRLVTSQLDSIKTAVETIDNIVSGAGANITQVGGTAVDTNSGSKSAGTLRVVLATDQPQPTNAFKVDGSAVTQPVSAASLPLPSGASIAAKQPALGTAGAASADVITVQGVASMTALKVDGSAVTQPVSGTVGITANSTVDVNRVGGTAVDANSGNKSAGTLRVVLATDQPALTNKLLVTPDANSAVNVAQINGVTPLMGAGNTGTGSPRITLATDQTTPTNPFHVDGAGAAGASVAGNPVRLGGLGRSTLPTTVSSAQLVDLLLDRFGRQYVIRPILSQATSNGTPITTNTNTTIIAAPSAGNHLRIYRLWAQNSSATGTWCYWGNGSGVKSRPFYLAQYQQFSERIDGGWELSTATGLFLNTATTGANIEWFVEYESLTD